MAWRAPLSALKCERPGGWQGPLETLESEMPRDAWRAKEDILLTLIKALIFFPPFYVNKLSFRRVKFCDIRVHAEILTFYIVFLSNSVTAEVGWCSIHQGTGSQGTLLVELP